MSAHSRRLRLDPIMCRAHGMCAELLPEMIELDEWGYPILPDGPVPRQLLADARAAVAACPTLALRLVRPEPDAPGHTNGRHRPESHSIPPL